MNDTIALVLSKAIAAVGVGMGCCILAFIWVGAIFAVWVIVGAAATWFQRTF